MAEPERNLSSTKPIREGPLGLLTVSDGDQVIAIVVRHSFRAPGIAFLTPDSYPMQLGYMQRAQGYTIQAHRHLPSDRRIIATMETLIVRSGRVRVKLFALNMSPLVEVDIEAGDIILLVAGGHGFEFLENGELVEVKQGPYLGVEDKQRIE